MKILLVAIAFLFFGMAIGFREQKLEHMGKSIEQKVGYVKHSNPINRKALDSLLNKPGVKACLMEDTLYSDASQEIRILISVPKEINK